MRILSRLLAAAAIATVAACGGTAEVPDDVDVDVKTDTVALPDVDVNRDTTTIVTPDIDVNRGGTDTNTTPRP